VNLYSLFVNGWKVPHVVAHLHHSRRFGGYNTACGSAGVNLKARDNLEELSEDGRIL